MTTELTAREAPARYVVAELAIPKGYKQTEVGVIPEDWDIHTLSAISKAPLQNGVFFKPSLKGIGVRLINVGDLYANAPIDAETLELFDATEQERERFKVEDGDLFFTRSSVVQSGIAYCNIYHGHKQEPVVFDSHVIRMRPDTRKVVPSYLFRFCVASIARRYLVAHAKTGSMTTIDQCVLGKCPVILPPTKAEQEAIAEALSDADALIAALEKLIAKKRSLKQGAMQELLTGKKRLPGFAGEWEVTRLGDLGATYGGLTGKTKADFGEGAARYITFMNVMENVVIDCETFEHVRVSPVETQNRAKKGDLFFNGSSETPEEVAMCAVLLEDVQDVYLNSFCFGFRFREGAEADGVFFAHYLRSREGRELMKSLAQGSTRYNLSKVALLNSLLRLPALPEQTAIATLLSDMDAEIASLETQLAKARGIKQGMMQELLTGKIRLV